MLAIVIDEFGKGRDLQVLTDDVDNTLMCCGKGGLKDMIHDVCVVFSKNGVKPWVA